MTTLTVTREGARGKYLLRDDHRNERASLQVGWPVRRGELRTDAGTWTVRRHGWRRVTVGDDDRPIVRLDHDAAMMPGLPDGGRWGITRTGRTYQGTLTHGSQAMLLRLNAASGRRCAVEVTGDWQQRDLVVLTACFAVLARRRRDITIVIAARGSHGR